MPLLVNSVPNLAQGVSQQPDNLRYPGQCDEQINAWATVVEGLKKRPNTNYVKNLDTDGTANIFTHFVKRDETNQYAIVVSLGNVSLGIPAGVSAYDVSLGTSIPVTVTSIANSYLSLGTSVTDPLNDLRALTVADYTFLVNKRKTVQVDDSDALKSKDLEYDAIITVNLGDYEKNYDIYLDNQLVTVSSSPTGLQSDQFPPSAGHTYESGDAQGSKGGEYSDTAVIAEDLELILEDYLAGQQGLGVVDLEIGGGSGFEDSGTHKPSGVLVFAKPVTTVKYEFFIDQYTDATHTTKLATGTKGTCVFSGGSLASYILTHRGINYDSTLATNTYKLIIRKITASQFGGFGGGDALEWSEYEDIDNSTPGYVLPAINSVSLTNSNFQVTRKGSVIKISADTDFTIRTEDGLADQALKVAYKEVDSITDLPKHCFNRFRVKIRGDADIDQDDYYVIFKTKDGEDFGEGSWVETVGWVRGLESSKEYKGINTSLNVTTMPVVLVIDSYDTITGKVNSFTLQTPNERSNVVKHNGVFYNLVEPHVSNSSNEPGGTVDDDGDGVADWKRYWVVTTAVNSAAPWKSDIQYFERATSYIQRQAGDDITNPFPSFVDQTINDVFFFKNRLGFVTDTSVIFSEADNYFNFFRTTTQQLLDSAPIDVGLSHTKVAILQHAIPFQEKLMLFSKQSQFVLRGADVLSPKTVAISPVTEYDISDSVEPVALGNYIYFTFKRNDFEGMYEYFVDNNTELFDAEEVTQQVPKYIPKDVRKIAGSQAENTLCIGVDSDLKTLYVYKYFWSNKEKIQSAWMKFTFDRDVVGFDFIDSKLYMITKDDEGLHLEFLTLEDGLTDEGLGYPLLLDSRVDGNDVTVSLYNASTKKTRISGIPYNVSLGTDIEIYTKIGTQRAITMVDNTTVDVTGALASYVSNGGTVYKCVHTDPDTQVHTSTAATEPGTGADWTDYWVVSTDFSSATAWALGKTYNDDTYFVIGKPYNMLYRFSNQAIKQPTERGGRSASDYTFQTIRNGSINYADTGHFVVEVTPEYRDTYKYVFNPDITGANLLLNEFEPQDGHFRFAVQGQPDKVTIEVKSDSALPCKLLAAEFESMVIPRSKRYGS
jgi:hypothetical protein